MKSLLKNSVLFPTHYLVGSLLLSGCQTIKSLQPAPVRPLTAKYVPDSFAGQADSGSIAGQSWRTFFSDSSLVQLIDTVLAGNLDLRITTQRIEQARANFDYSRGFLAPQVNVVASAGVDRYSQYSMSGVGNYDTNLSRNINQRQIAPNPTPDYFLGARSTVTELAVQQFTAQLINTRSRQGQVRQQIIETENALNRLLGRYPQPIARGRSLQERELPGQVLAGLPAQMLTRRPDIRQAELDLAAANVDVEVVRAEFLPGLNLSGYVGFMRLSGYIIGIMPSMSRAIKTARLGKPVRYSV